ncbi:hypothetical protein N7517_000126 [Penicillium concentricum]|uniref:Uncharacterized protein n=1 Tax=Penicillium concentricum TaxID=293559 RepID=A0A9W9SQE6_9EURO|nr:uncharacterized protein N7517_000126 [Penicillium concentricum]KAJ5382215.1 hypothetical protein N7517_000126 [Penicillium concentricum]
MPKCTPIAAPLREALIECFRAATRLVRPELRRQLILVGGAGSIAHDSVLYTEDVDVAAPSDVIHDICKGVMDGTARFSLEPDGKIAFDACQGIRVRIDVIEIGDAIERIHVAEPFFDGSVASMSDLLRLRAVTVVERGSDGEVADFRWLLAELAKAGQIIPGLNAEELEYMRGAGRCCLEVVDCLLLYSILQEEDGRLVLL